MNLIYTTAGVLAVSMIIGGTAFFIVRLVLL